METVRMDVMWLRGSALEVGVITYGARIVAVRTPDRDGTWAEIALGLADLDAYRRARPRGRHSTRLPLPSTPRRPHPRRAPPARRGPGTRSQLRRRRLARRAARRRPCGR